ncbi:SCO family protein [Planctomyces sp. SH-PL14]|uniref:SCO family protein n=1 Tax=Planctomyces sp. SH-PL14 TaxID=1632864 RepID=UPI00078DA3B8|nr:SCO family protein [Planctomyces sp. SH-PL14]AMV20113.1 hypothetical protein VT03_19615 [Planctomyces sp. SH-PL14]
MSSLSRILALVIALLTPALAAAQVPRPMAVGSGEILKSVRFEQRLGGTLSLDEKFRDDQGREIRLADCFGARPVVLTFVYHECPMLCGQVLQGLVQCLKAIDFTPGREYNVVVISISPTETPALAAGKKRSLLNRFGRPETAAGWHFLTGDEASIRTIADEAGYRYEPDPKTGQYAHPSGLIVVTPDGKLSKYFFGIDFPTRDVRLALVEAAEERIGTVVDQLLLLCFHYDPSTGRYSLTVMRTLQLAGLLTLGVMGSGIYSMLRQERLRVKAVEETAEPEREEAVHG